MRVIIKREEILNTPNDLDLGAKVREALNVAVCDIDDRTPSKCTDNLCICEIEV